MRGLTLMSLADAAGGARRLRDLVPDLRQLTERARGEHRVRARTARVRRPYAAGHDVLRAEPKHGDDAAEGEEHAAIVTNARAWAMFAAAS